MKRTAVRLSILCACLPGVTALAADFDGSKPLICAPTEAVDMPTAGEVKTNARPGDLGLPAFMRIDVARKTIVGSKRTSPIRYVDQGEKQLTMQGTEMGFAWTIVVNTEDGTMTGTFADRFGVVSLTGACAPMMS